MDTFKQRGSVCQLKMALWHRAEYGAEPIRAPGTNTAMLSCHTLDRARGVWCVCVSAVFTAVSSKWKFRSQKLEEGICFS